MTRVHYFSFIADDNGQPIPGVDISIFLAGTIIPANIYTNEFGGNVISETPQLITNEKGYFEFWIGNEEDINGYSTNQKFKIVWEKSGITSGYIDWIDIFPQVYPVDEQNYDSTVKNKVINNRLSYLWEQHRNHDVTVDFFPVHGFEAFNPYGDPCTEEGVFTPEQETVNKIISDKFAYIWNNHANFSFTSSSSATSATSAASGCDTDVYNVTAHGLKPVEFDDNDNTFNKIVSNYFMKNYASIDGTQSFTDPVSGIYPTNDNHLSTKEYIDDINEQSNDNRFVKSTNKRLFSIKSNDWILKQNNEYYYIIKHSFNEEFPNVLIWDDDLKVIDNNYQLKSLNHQQLIIYSGSKKNLSVIVDNNILESSKVSQREFLIEDFEQLDDKYFINVDYTTEYDYPYVQVWNKDTRTLDFEHIVYKNPLNYTLTIKMDDPLDCIVNISHILEVDNKITINEDVEENNIKYFDITTSDWTFDGSLYYKIISHNTNRLYPSIVTWDIDTNLVISLYDIESIDNNTIKVYSETTKNIKLTLDEGEYNNFQIDQSEWIYNSWGGYYYTLLKHNLQTLYTNVYSWNTDTNKAEILSNVSAIDHNTILLHADNPINLSVNVQYSLYTETISKLHWVENTPNTYEYVVNHNKNIEYPIYSVWNISNRREEVELVKNIEYIDVNSIKIITYEPLNAKINISSGFISNINEIEDTSPNNTIAILDTEWTYSNNIYSKEIKHNLNILNPHVYVWNIDTDRIVDVYNIKYIDNNTIVIYSLQNINILVSFENNFGDLNGYTNHLMDAKLDKAGDIMSGILDMAGNTITNIPLPMFPDEVVNKGYVDNMLSLTMGVSGSYAADGTASYIDTATTLYNADQLLDDQIKINENLINQEIVDRQNAILSVQNELDYTQAQAGLDTDGSYIADGTANYIDTATTLFNADQLLDAQVKINTDGLAQEITDRQDSVTALSNSISSYVSDLQDELNYTQAHAGLDTYGSYNSDPAANYIDIANTLFNADQLLDTQVKVNEDAITQLDLDLANGLALKVSKAGDIMSGNLNMSNNKIISLNNPTADADAANKYYVDSVAQGLAVKDSVRVATTGNIILYGTQTIDGVAVVAGNRVLVKNQTNAIENGVYIVNSVSGSRSPDFDGTPTNEVKGGVFTFIDVGTINGNTGWVVINDGTIDIGTDPVNATQFTSLGQIVAGAGIHKNGNELYVGFGAGIKELPTDDIGLDLYNTGGLFLTENGTTASSSTSSLLAIKLADNSLSLSASGLSINQSFTSKKFIINSTGWTSSGGMYEVTINHNLNEQYPSITVWNTDIEEIEKMSNIISIDNNNIKIISEYQLNILVKVLK